MLVPLMLPEALVVALIVGPVGLHIRQQVIATLFLQDRSDVGVLARGIAELLVRAVAVVGPEDFSETRHSFVSQKGAYQSP
jgi:hypothetical protein